MTTMVPAAGGFAALVGALAAGLTAQAAPRAPLFTFQPDAAPVRDVAPSRGAAWGDYDGDGDPDLYVSRSAGHSSMLYRNDGGRLVPLPGSPLSVDDGNAEGAAWVDLDGDGDLDLYAVNRSGRPALLFENLGAGSFRARSDAVLTAPRNASMTCFADADLDGDLDAFVVGYRDSPNVLAANDGRGGFTELPLPDEARGSGTGRTCAWGDLNGTGRPELFVGNAREPNVLLAWRPDGGWQPVDDPHVTTHVAYTYGSSWADVDEDGDLDLFVANFDSGNVLYENTGGSLRPRPDGATPQSAASKGHAWGDFDLDGSLDLYLGSGTPAPQQHNVLHLGDGRGAYRAAPPDPWLLHADTSAAVAAADYDLDGHLDLFVANWGSPRARDRLHRATGSERGWVAFHLRGTESNRLGVGATVSVLATVAGEQRWRYRTLAAATGYAGQDETVAHFGLGDAVRVDSLVVRWPAGRRVVYPPPELRRRWVLTEDGSVRPPPDASILRSPIER